MFQISVVSHITQGHDSIAAPSAQRLGHQLISYSCRSLEPSQSVAHISSFPALSAREMIHSAQYFERN
jgi:hypothetical protein